MNRRVAIRLVAGIAVSVIAVLLVARATDVPTAFAQVAKVDPRSLIAPVVVIVVQLVIRAARWSGLLTAMAGVGIGTRQVVGPLSVGYLGNIVLPARLGEVVRIVLVSRRTSVSMTGATASVVVERGVDLLALLTIATVASVLIGAPAAVLIAGLVVLLVALVVAINGGTWIAARLPAFVPARVRDIIVRLAAALTALDVRVLGRAYLLSLLAWVCDGAVIGLCAAALGIQLSPGVAMLLATGAALGVALPAASGYLGTYELGILTMASFVGLPSDQAIQVALLAHAMAIVPLAVIGLVALAVMTVNPVAARAPEPEQRDLAGGAS